MVELCTLARVGVAVCSVQSQNLYCTIVKYDQIHDEYAGVSHRNVRLCYRVLEVKSCSVLPAGIFFDEEICKPNDNTQFLSYSISFVYSVSLPYIPQSHNRCFVDCWDYSVLGRVILSSDVSSSYSHIAEDSSLLGCCAVL